MNLSLSETGLWSNISLQDHARPNRQLGASELAVAHDLWSRLLRRRNDASLHASLRSRSAGYNFPRFASTVRRYDRSRNPHQQDGSGAETGVRPDARSPVGHLYG